MSTPHHYALSPEHSSPLASPRRRQYPAQPPSLLTTSLNNAQGLGHGYGFNAHTPISTTTLSSPFSLHHQSPYAASPGGAMRDQSPMAYRSETGFSAPYNPQQWGHQGQETSPGTHTATTIISMHTRQSSSRTTTFAARPIGPDEPIASPPPPYSPQRTDGSSDSVNAIISPSDTMSPDTDYSQSTTPVSAATTMSPGLVVPKAQRRSPTSMPRSQSGSTLAGPSTAFPPPPPAHSGGRIRSSSKNHTDRILAAINMRKNNSNTPPANAIDTLQDHTALALARAPESQQWNDSAPLQVDPSLRPPAARRAASTGAIGYGGNAERSTSVSPSPAHWEPGMALPPPPPGPPPPPTNRSQSLSRPSQASLLNHLNVAPRTRQHPGRGTTLETVPPTPANWTEEGNQEANAWPARPSMPQPLHVDTSNIPQQHQLTDEHVPPSAHPGETSTPAHVRRGSASGMLLRSPAVRNRSANKGIRERRSESRSGKARATEDPIQLASDDLCHSHGQIEVKPTNLPLLDHDTIAKRRMSARQSPRSGKSIRGLDEALHSAHSAGLNSAGLLSHRMAFDSSHSTPRLEPTAQLVEYPKPITPTPPFSPGAKSFPNIQTNGRASPYALTNALPTPPLQPNRDMQSSLGVPRTSDPRPISSLLHTPNPEVSIAVMPLSPESSQSLIDVDGHESPRTFANSAIERHRMFTEREMAAKCDEDKLHLFVQYMIAESRIRRDQYATLFEDEQIDPASLTEGMFESLAKPDDSIESFYASHSHGKQQEESRRSSGTTFSESHSQRASTTATSEQALTLDTSVNAHGHNQTEPSRWNDYVPCLSPIASMSAVTGRDEMDSRGRAPSRWWENHSNASHEDGFNTLARSKRESKYMAEAHDAPLLEDRYSYSSGTGTSNPPVYGQDEYPPEKTGWHEETTPLPPPPAHPPTPMSAPFTPDPRKLDVSRLITLPPPYPRHHPAVNNSHPDLADIRNTVRSLTEFNEPNTAREAYQSRMVEKRQRADSWCKHQRSLHDQDIQFRMEHGEISQEQFDEAEVNIEAKEAQSEKDLTKAEFDTFQDTVVTPVHALYTDRIALATTTFDSLSSRLFTDAQSTSPNLPQEEGDEQPELLEKLTQLKWLFEARETLHRETFALLSERNDKFGETVLLTYRQARNADKLADAERFFVDDALKRRAAFDAAALERTRAFGDIIASHVTRGVEIQISAFWDIAPGILELLQQVPTDRGRLAQFEILVPRQEVDENPSYWSHPLRYLYSLLRHAESSTRQFIESQVSLWCLLQEVREAVCGAKWRAEESRVVADAVEGRSPVDEGRWVEGRRREEAGLVEDLKEKVGVVEGQWDEALGREVRRVREGVRAWLEQRGGWDEELEGL